MYNPEIIDKITLQVDMLDILGRYGFSLNSRGFTCCPFHQEDTPSFKVYANNQKYKCFGCGEVGSVIDFVRKLFGLNFGQAIAKLDYDFSLRLNLGQRISLREQQRICAEIKAREAARSREKAEKEAASVKYYDTVGEWLRMAENRSKYAPLSLENELHPLFVESLQKQVYIEYILDCWAI